MANNKEEQCQRGYYFSIIDEVDSILVDEARTPLIISGPSQDRSDLYVKVDALMPDKIVGIERDNSIERFQPAAAVGTGRTIGRIAIPAGKIVVAFHWKAARPAGRAVGVRHGLAPFRRSPKVAF